LVNDNPSTNNLNTSAEPTTTAGKTSWRDTQNESEKEELKSPDMKNEVLAELKHKEQHSPKSMNKTERHQKHHRRSPES
jgi:hypothetical protein